MVDLLNEDGVITVVGAAEVISDTPPGRDRASVGEVFEDPPLHYSRSPVNSDGVTSRALDTRMMKASEGFLMRPAST
jgi:hypothetical protein